MKTLTTVMLVLFAVLAPPAAAEDISWTLVCKTETVRGKVRAGMEDYDLKIFDADYASRCPRMDRPEKPVHGSAERSRDKSHSDWIYDARYSTGGKTILSASRDDGKYAATTSMASDLKVWEIATGPFDRRSAST